MTLAILILEDEPDVRDALERDVLDIASTIRIDVAEDVDDAWAVIEEIDADGDQLALALCDHRLPGTTGVDFLVEMMADERTVATRKVLVTGQADLVDTIKAVNAAQLDHYIAKPWDATELRSVITTALTDYIEDQGINPMPYMAVIDKVRAMEILKDY